MWMGFSFWVFINALLAGILIWGRIIRPERAKRQTAAQHAVFARPAGKGSAS
jgi:hypothetical protein